MYKGFKMKLYPGMEEEYERRHNLLWPEMQESIHAHGGKDYSIYLDPETLTLFGSIWIDDEEEWAKQADDPINRKWWDFMADIMDTNPDNPSTANGGTLWPTSWTRTRTTAPSARICILYSIWIKKPFGSGSFS